MKKYNGVLYNLLGGVIFMVWLSENTKENVMNIIRDECGFEIIDEGGLFELLKKFNLFLTEDEIIDDFVDLLDIGMKCRGFDIRNYLNYNSILEEQCRLRLRHVPELIFTASDSIEYSANISRILNDLNK